MWRRRMALIALAIAVLCALSHVQCAQAGSVGPQERARLRAQVKEMFDHAFRAYMENAYPADELMPLSCTGRVRGVTPDRGDIDESLGNFSLTLIDAMDTLAVLGDIDGFHDAIDRVRADVRFDNDVVVSVFETNIRVVGGLLSAHVLALDLAARSTDDLNIAFGPLRRPFTYDGVSLLRMAEEVASRLLPAFETPTGIPRPRVNLRTGVSRDMAARDRTTCTACAGTILLEFGALSRLTGNATYEAKARRAMRSLWDKHANGLVGNVIDVVTGQWIRQDSGIGAGIDSYYEYCLKAHMLLHDPHALDAFNRHYEAVMTHLKRGALFVDVQMHQPWLLSRNIMDSLQAFWPGLQVLHGDVESAIETHRVYAELCRRFGFIPEAFTFDLEAVWNGHPLRPEFAESTYYLYRATGDHYYLEVGRDIVQAMDSRTRVKCGFASVADVLTGRLEDRLDSYVLAENFKYLYLLFADDEHVPIRIDDYIFTTEAHLLPLSLSRKDALDAALEQTPDVREKTPEPPKVPRKAEMKAAQAPVAPSRGERGDTCPNTVQQLRFGLFMEAVGGQRTIAEGENDAADENFIPIEELDFVRADHIEYLRLRGVQVVDVGGGRYQLTHSMAGLPWKRGQEGIAIIKALMELHTKRKEAARNGVHALRVTVLMPWSLRGDAIAGPALFGSKVREDVTIVAPAIYASPEDACTPLVDIVGRRLAGVEFSPYRGRIVVAMRGKCMFVEKARNIEAAGGVAMVVVDTADDESFFSMTGDGTSDVTIYAAIVSKRDGVRVAEAARNNGHIEIARSEEEK
eukprot:Opistho-1_new@24500